MKGYKLTQTGAEVQEILNAVDDKQDQLVSGTNIKTINNQSILGPGNISVITSETDPTVPNWAKQSNKPSYTALEVGAVPTTRTVNGKALSADITLSASDVDALPSSTVIPDAQIQSDWNQTTTTAKDYIKNKPTIPSISGLESTSNKVTSLSAASTDTQYPSAKCVYDLVGDIETLLAAI